ncbi:MAG: hypothetical protein WDM91_06300 [Rhizomicrobium sp.]
MNAPPTKAAVLWRMPLLLAGLTLFGLLDALLVDNNLARILAWAALAAPLGATIRCLHGAFQAAASA